MSRRTRGRLAAVSPVIALVLVAAGMSPVSASPAPTPPKPPAKTACPDEMPGEASVRLAVRLCGKRIKVADLTTKTAEYFVNRSENLSDSLSLFLLHRPVPMVARWSYLISTGVLRLLREELPGDVHIRGDQTAV